MVITFKLSGRKCFLDHIELLKIEYIRKATICHLTLVSVHCRDVCFSQTLRRRHGHIVLSIQRLKQTLFREKVV